MRAPVRMVCGDCLRSLELVMDELGQLPTLCPVCGGTIDSRLSEMETPASRHHTMPLGRDHAPNDLDNRWLETWHRGSLGTIGRFQLRELLGDGGFGQVYQAYDPRLDRDVALKVLKQNHPGDRAMQRFFREARAVARLAHPNIAAVYDAGSEAGRCWIAYEFVEGRTLARLIDHQETPDIELAAQITRDLADALDHAHREGVFHRDLKPANIIVDPAGDPHLIDFGLARRADLDSNLTRDGAILGTPNYMSPEQANGQSHLADQRSDIYSLGVMLYELLCGRRPVEMPADLPTWQTRLREPVQNPRSINPEIPRALEAIALKALEVNPQARYANARALVDDLDRWLLPGPAGSSRRLMPPLVGAAVGALLAFAAGLYGLRGSPDPARAGADPQGPIRPALASVPFVPTSMPMGLVRSVDGKSYHLADCPHARSIAPEKRRACTIEGAIADGLKPCKSCKPDAHLGGRP